MVDYVEIEFIRTHWTVDSYLKTIAEALWQEYVDG